MSDDFRQRVADALDDLDYGHDQQERRYVFVDDARKAVLAVRDEELERLRVAEVASIGAHALLADAEAAIARVRRLCDLTIASSCRVQAIEQAADTLAALDHTPGAVHDCDPPDEPAEDSPREWLCPICGAAWDRIEHSEDEGEIYETWYEKRDHPEESRG